MHFVDEQQDPAVARRHLGENRLQPLFELAAILGARNESPHVERHEFLVREIVGNVAVDDPQGQSLRDGRLADTRFANQDRIVLGSPGQDLHGSADFVVATDDGIDLPFPRICSQIPRKAIQGVIPFVGGFGIDCPAHSHPIDRCLQLVCGDIPGTQRRSCIRLDLGKGEQQGFDRHKAIIGRIGNPLRFGQDLVHVLVDVDSIRGSGHLRLPCKVRVACLANDRQISACLSDQIRHEARFVVDHRPEQVVRHEALVVTLLCHDLRGLDKPARTFGQFLVVHVALLAHGVVSAIETSGGHLADGQNGHLQCDRRNGVGKYSGNRVLVLKP